nr:MAG TPA: hypothetical protein [Caudoviricetes sp.]
MFFFYTKKYKIILLNVKKIPKTGIKISLDKTLLGGGYT